MNIPDVEYPIPVHDTWKIVDSTKLGAYMDCPRSFFYNYLLGWRNSSPNIHLEFGSAWHSGMEVLEGTRRFGTKGYSPEHVKLAIEAFQTTLFERLGVDINNPLEIVGLGVFEQAPAKSLENGIVALIDYTKMYNQDEFQTLYTEVSGSIPISAERNMYFKIDTILQNVSDVIFARDHKTTGRLTQAWQNQWQTDIQMMLYAHVIFAIFGEDRAKVEVNGAVLRSPKRDGTINNDFIRIPVMHHMDTLQQGLWDLNYWYDRLEWDLAALARCSEDDDVMRAFPRNPKSCNKFGCKFAGMCALAGNPLRRVNEPPPGFKIEFWDPRKSDTPAEEKIEVISGVTAKAIT